MNALKKSKSHLSSTLKVARVQHVDGTRVIWTPGTLQRTELVFLNDCCSNYDIIQKLPVATLPLFNRPAMSEQLTLCVTDCSKCTLGVKKWLSPGKNA